MKSSIIIGISMFAANLLAQTPVITKVLNAGIGDTSFAPLSIVYIYGSFPAGQARDFSITVGGVAGYVNVANSTGYITAVLPPGAPLGQQPLVISYQGNNSAPYPITLAAYAPEFETVTVVPVTSTGPQFPLASYYPIAHSNLTPVTPAAPAAPGERLVSLLSGMGTTSPPIKLGAINSFESLTVQPTILVGNLNAPVARAGSSGTSVEVDFYVPGGTTPDYWPVVLNIASYRSNIVNIPVATQPLVTAVLNAGSFGSSGTVAPGSIVSIFGIGFGPADNLTAFPSTNPNGTSAMFGTTAAPIYALATVEGQINAQVPAELATSGTVALTVTSNLGVSSTMTLNLAPAVPGMFYYPDPTVSTRRNAVALIGNTQWIAMPTSMAGAMGLPNNCAAVSPQSTCGHPAHIGDVLQVFVTGLGKATPEGDPNALALATGTVAPAGANPLYMTVQQPIVTIGGAPAQVQFSGIAPGFAGLYQVNVQIPAGIQTGDDVPITIAMPGSTVDKATIAVSAQ